MASSTGKWALGTTVVAGITLLVGTAVIGVEGVAANGPVPPEPPTNVNVPTTTGPSESVHFTPPENDGGDPVTGYTATCTSDNGGAEKSATGDASPISVTELTYGKTYACHVTAKNEHGTSVESQPSNSFVPVTVPAVPRPVSSLPYGPKTVKVIWSRLRATVVRRSRATCCGRISLRPCSPSGRPHTGDHPDGERADHRPHLFVRDRGGERRGNGAVFGQDAARRGRISGTAPERQGAENRVRIAPGDVRRTREQRGHDQHATPRGATPRTAAPTTRGHRRRLPAAITVTGLTAGKSYTCAVKATNNRGTGPLSTRTPSITA